MRLVGRVGVQPEERPDRPGERDEDGERREPACGAARDASPGERDRERAGQGRREAEPRSWDHPRSSDNWSTSRARLRRWIATTRPRPTHTSEAATAITASAKIWPAPF